MSNDTVIDGNVENLSRAGVRFNVREARRCKSIFIC